jgi:hypothetical protein
MRFIEMGYRICNQRGFRKLSSNSMIDLESTLANSRGGHGGDHECFSIYRAAAALVPGFVRGL